MLLPSNSVLHIAQNAKTEDCHFGLVVCAANGRAYEIEVKKMYTIRYEADTLL